MNRQAAEPRQVRQGLLEPDEHLDALARGVIGAALEVHRTLGPGYLESVYSAALSVELRTRSIPFARQVQLAVIYRNEDVGTFRADFLIDGRLIVELKAVEALNELHQAQLISYMKAARLHLGLLINFNVPLLRQGVKRVVVGRDHERAGARPVWPR